MRKRQMALASAAYETYAIGSRVKEEQEGESESEEIEVDTEWMHDSSDDGDTTH
jgi:hypothetical protein